jgi:hypothetical protein
VSASACSTSSSTTVQGTCTRCAESSSSAVAGGAGLRGQNLDADAALGQRLAYGLRPLGEELASLRAHGGSGRAAEAAVRRADVGLRAAPGAVCRVRSTTLRPRRPRTRSTRSPAAQH